MDNKMGFLQELDALQVIRQHQRTCLIAEFIKSWSDEEKAAVEAAFDNPKYTGKAIHQVLRNRGAQFSNYPVRRHRMKECACGDK